MQRNPGIMGKRKGKGKKKNKRKISSSKGILHREAECARKIIQFHPSVNGKVGVPRSQTNGGFEINFEMSVSLPSRSNKRGITETGVKSREPVILCFPTAYPFQAPAILLRPDFNRSLPHLNPVLGSNEKSYIVPCVYDGPLDDLLHQEGDGLSEILNQLSEWFAKAAIDDLIDPRQGWEPIRRDDTFGWVVHDLMGLRALVQDKKGALIFQCRFWELKERKEQLYFVGGIDHRKQRGITPLLIKNSFFADKSLLRPSYVSLTIFAWANSEAIVDRYLPESIYSLEQLYARAKEYGCYEPLRNVFISLCWAIKEASLDMPVFPIFIILCVRRPCDLIGDDSPLELIPYVVECHVEDAKLPFAESAIRIRKDSPVFPLGHRHALTSNLLRRMSGGTDTMKDGPIVHIGCGSVGSKIAMHLARSGHGPFKLIDKAAFSPNNVAPADSEPCPEEWIHPALWNQEGMFAEGVHGNDPDHNGRDGHDGVLDYIGPDNTGHATQDGIEHGKQGKYNSVHMGHILGSYIKWYIRGYHLPGDEDLHKFTQPDKAIGEETQAGDQGKNHYDPMRLHSSTSLAKPGGDPLCSGGGVGTPQPDGEKNHQENLVKDRP